MTASNANPPPVEQLSKLLDSAGIACDDVHQIKGGWSYWTFDVDTRWIVRFPRSDSVAQSLQREIAFLPHISEHVPFSVPQFRHVGSFRGHPFVVYPRIAGQPLARRHLDAGAAGGVASALTALHNVPPKPLMQGQPAALSADSWRERYASLRLEAQSLVRPLLEPSLASQMDTRWATFLERDLDTLGELAVVHYDLGPEHILVHRDGCAVAGIIDFEEVALGDPAVDFVGVLCGFGISAARSVCERYGRLMDCGFEPRLRFYACLGAYHAIVHGLQVGDDTIVANGIVGLRGRLQAEMLGAW